MDLNNSPTTQSEVNKVQSAEPLMAQSFLKTAFDHNLPMAAWRLPGETVQHYIIDTSSQLNFVEPDLSALPEGFLVHPFNNYPFSMPENAPLNPLLIKADIHFDSANLEVKVNHPNNDTSSIAEQKKALYHTIINNCNSKQGSPSGYFTNGHTARGNTPKSNFIDTVKKALAEIQAGNLQKVVPSRIKTAPLEDDFDPIHSFLSLCQTYSQAFISLVSIPNIGTWLGASPEILIKSFLENETNRRIFQTVALAGTQPIKNLNDIRKVSWRQKEIEEQAMVSRYIINCFKHIRLRDFEELGPKTVQAGNLMHLKTLFTVDMDKTNFPELPSIMLKLLHPTSAVCGMPKEPSLRFINQNEGHNRELFSGYLGPVHLYNRMDLFVNLRCVKLEEGQAVYYSGAGITADSDAAHEWHETEIKINTLSAMISKNKKR